MNLHTTIIIAFILITIYTITIFIVNFYLNKKLKQLQSRLDYLKTANVDYEMQFVYDAIQIAQRLNGSISSKKI